MSIVLEELRERLRRALTERSASQATLDGIVGAVEARGARNLTAHETARFDEARSTATALDTDIADLRDRIDELDTIDQRAAASATLTARIEGRTDMTTTTRVRVGSEPLTYTERNDSPNFIQDAFLSQYRNDPAASERIARHGQEMSVEYRATGTGAYTTGLIVPAFLADQYAALARAGRPLLNAIQTRALPDDGMTVNLARITTGSTVAAQATENTAVSNTDVAGTLLSVPVCTYAGQQVVSRQAVERGVGVDNAVLGDLIAGYAAALDSAAINGPGTGGTHLGILATAGINAVTLSTATVAALIPKLADAIQRVNATRFAPANVIVMHPRRWAWLLAAVDTAGRPVVVPNPSYSPMNAMGAGEALGNTGSGYVGTLMGLPVIVDANIPVNLGAGTNEDRIIVGYLPDLALWEQPDSPVSLRFDETAAANLSVTLVVYGFSAFSAGKYPAGISVISGTGLVTPTF